MAWWSRRAPAAPPVPPSPAPATRNALFGITAGTEAMVLDGLRIGHLHFVVENRSPGTLVLRCAAMAREPLDPAWLTPRLPSFELDAGDRREVTVDIAVPATAPAGVRIAHLLVWSVANPDEDFLSGPEVALTVPAYRPPRAFHIPGWVWGVLVVVALLVGNAVVARGVVEGFQKVVPITRVGVPTLVGLTPGAAAQALGTHLVPGTVTTRCTAQAPRGTVVLQTPPAGTIVTPGTAIDVLVEDGWTLPDFRGNNALAAVETCQSQGFTAATTTRIDATRPEPFGTVIGQTPAPGTIVGSGNGIRLTVLGGVVLPNLVGGEHQAAVEALTTLGLRLRPRLVPAPGPVGPGMVPVVIAQDPPAGQQVQPGTTVNLDLQVQARP
jgi:beta-lactam-binding protein with PASTA domain